MKKLIIIMSFLAAAIIILIASGFINAVLLFIVVGVVPGTNYTMSADTMLTIIIGISWTILLPFVSFKRLYTNVVRHFEKLQLLLKKHLARPSFVSKA
jgi:hypothetical protein